MKATNPKAASSESVEAQVAGFIAKFGPVHAALIRQCRAELRKLMPTAVELVYDNYNFFVIGYGPTPRPSDAVLSLAAAANGVGLAFLHGAGLPDPAGLLQGAGKQNRFVRIPRIEELRRPAVLALIRAALGQSRTPLAPKGPRQTIVRSVSAKQRPRRRVRTEDATR